MLASMQGSVAFGFIYSMVLVDEKDTGVAKVYGILPVSQFWFVVFRLIPPFFLATISTFLLLLVGHLHEPLRPVGRRGDAVLQARARRHHRLP
jgi:fluoroquinolone transport system permease protein